MHNALFHHEHDFAHGADIFERITLNSDYVRDLLRKSIEDRSLMAEKFEFNRFEVTIDRASGSVLLEDVLDASVSGAERIGIEDFALALETAADNPDTKLKI